MAENTRETQLRGLTTEWRTMTYNWRDCALYALAVGAKGDEPQYTYENGMQAIPTFGATPYWGTANGTPKLPHPRAIPVLVEELLRPERSYVNLDYEFLYHRPIPAVKGSFVYRDVLTDLFDRGEGRGMAVRSQVEVFDEGGTLLCTNRCTTLFPTLGGYGGQHASQGQPESPNGKKILWSRTTSARRKTCSTASPATQTSSTWTGTLPSAGAWTGRSSMTCAPTATSAVWPPPSSSPATRRS